MVQRNCMIIVRRMYKITYYVKNVRVKRLQCSVISSCFLVMKYFLKKETPVQKNNETSRNKTVYRFFCS